MLTLLAAVLAAPAALAQETPAGFRDEFMGKFNYAAQRLVALAEAMPEAAYGWRPGGGVMSVEEVYMHIARYNYYYPESSLGIKAPEDVDVPNLESITGKAVVVEHLRRSLAHVREAVEPMTEEDLRRSATLYGRDTQAWAVLFQLLTHLSEHLGQSIAYARTNGVVPPWSQ